MKVSQRKMLLLVSCALALPGASSAQQSTATVVKTAATPAVTTTDVTTTGGQTSTLAAFTGATSIGNPTNSQLYTNLTSGGLGIGRGPAAALDVLGQTIFRGGAVFSRSGEATTTAGKPSFQFQFQSSVWNSHNNGTLIPNFTMQSEPTGNNTTTTGATLNFLYYSGIGSAPAETGLYINPTGVIHFAPAQTFPITTGATGPAGPQGPTGPAGPQGPQGPAGPIGSVPANLTAISGQLSTTNGVAYLGSDRFQYPGACVIGDVFLSVNGYGSGNALPADGRSIPIQGNTALFTLIGINFGGNGTSTYALPDLRAFAPKGMQYSICLNGTFPSEN